MKPMRLLIASRSTPFHRLGGMEIVAWDIARELARRGHQVEILTTRVETLLDSNVIDGVSIRALDVPSGRYSGQWWKLSRERFRNQYAGMVDLVLGIGGGAHAMIDERRASSLEVPIVIQSHGTPWSEIVSKLSVPTPRSFAGAVWNLQFLRRDTRLQHYSHIIPIGQAVQQQLSSPPMSWLKGDTASTVIENGVDEQHFRFDAAARSRIRQELGIPQDAKAIISVSRLISQKGCQKALCAVVEAMKKVEDLHYLIAGEGPALAELQAMAAGAGVKQKLHFLGAVNRDRIPEYLSAADGYLLATVRQEGLAIAPLEAAANGLRCVLSRHIVPAELDCIAADPENTSQVAEAVLAILSSPRSRLSLLPERYSLRYSVDQYEKLFARLIEKSRRLEPAPQARVEGQA